MSTITAPAAYIEAFLADTRAFEADAIATARASMGRGWGAGAGEISVYRGAQAIDTTLDLLSAARANSMDQAAEVCEKFLGEISLRPGAVTTTEIIEFCKNLRDVVAS